MTVNVFRRSIALDDIAIRAGGDGRTVVAYAATFTPYEVTDEDGHYEECILPTGFNRSLSHGIDRFQVLYNHGRAALSGQPMAEYGLPIAVPLEVRADGRGLLTVSRYLKTPLADMVLELIRDGGIRGQSFSGIWKHSRLGTPRADGLPRIERVEVALREYGPTPFPVAHAADIVGVRSLLDEVRQLPAEQRAQLLGLLSATDTPPGPADTGTPEAGPPVATDTPAQPAAPAPAPQGPSIDQLVNAQRRRR
ncbi:HK97 family phage prohead protease [Catellatospora sp. NPDC049609]|uniref:HK97 family phage prohead protease n=1 Tax=Catellatospora sp. NPDC049609 TaxID=3155505 RepID=UPI0034302265